MFKNPLFCQQLLIKHHHIDLKIYHQIFMLGILKYAKKNVLNVAQTQEKNVCAQTHIYTS